MPPGRSKTLVMLPRLDHRCPPGRLHGARGSRSIPVPVCSRGDSTILEEAIKLCCGRPHKGTPALLGGWRISGFRVQPPPQDGASWPDPHVWAGTGAGFLGSCWCWRSRFLARSSPFPHVGRVAHAGCAVPGLGRAVAWARLQPWRWQQRGRAGGSRGGDVRWGRVGWRCRARGWRQRCAQAPAFPSLALLHPAPSESPGPRQKPLSGARMSPAAAWEGREELGQILPQPGVSWWSMAGCGLSPAPWLRAEDRGPRQLLGALRVLVLMALVWESCAASREREPRDQVMRLGPPRGGGEPGAVSRAGAGAACPSRSVLPGVGRGRQRAHS